DAADLVQEVFKVLVRKLPEFTYDRDRTFRGWLHVADVAGTPSLRSRGRTAWSRPCAATPSRGSRRGTRRSSVFSNGSKGFDRPPYRRATQRSLPCRRPFRKPRCPR